MNTDIRTLNWQASKVEALEMQLITELKRTNSMAMKKLGHLNGKLAKVTWIDDGEEKSITGEFNLHVPSDDVVEKKLISGHIFVQDFMRGNSACIRFSEVVDITDEI